MAIIATSSPRRRYAYVRDAFGRQAGKQLAIEKAAPDQDWGIGATERRRLLAEIEALDGAPPPATDDDFGIGLGL